MNKESENQGCWPGWLRVYDVAAVFRSVGIPTDEAMLQAMLLENSTPLTDLEQKLEDNTQESESV